MPRQLTALHDQYKAIYTHKDAAGAYADFERGVRELMDSGADPADIASVSRQDPEALDRIQRTRAVEVYYRPGDAGGPRFRGSGVIIAADQDGIAAYDYQIGNGDPVAAKYGSNEQGQPTPYQWVALLKVGRAALLHTSGRTEGNFAESYRWLDRQLIEQDLKGVDAPPHHLGYSWRQQHGLRVAVGASGLLVAEAIAAVRDLREIQTIAVDEAADWVGWPLDRFAGYDDAYGARSVAQQMVGGGSHPEIASVNELWRQDINLH